MRWPGDGGKAAAKEELGGGGAQARSVEGDSGDGCGEDQARASTSYSGWREAEATGIGGAAAVNGILNGAITRVKGGGRKCGRVKGGNDWLDRSGPLHGVGGGQHGGTWGGGSTRLVQAKEEEGGR